MGKELNSSNLRYAEHDSATNTLTVTFNTGAVYAYTPVSKEGYKSLCNAESAGKYFYENIKNNPNISCVKVKSKD